MFIIQILMSKDLDGLFWYSLTAQIYWRILVSKAISISKQSIYIVCCGNPNYTPPPLKNRGDVVLSRVFLSTEFAYGPFHALEALSSLVNKRRQNGIFFLFQFGFFSRSNVVSRYASDEQRSPGWGERGRMSAYGFLKHQSGAQLCY